MAFGREKHEMMMGMGKKDMMMEWLVEMMTEDEKKMMAVKKMDMKVMALEQKLEYTKWLRDWLKGKM
jgi:hypothetical protein